MDGCQGSTGRPDFLSSIMRLRYPRVEKHPPWGGMGGWKKNRLIAAGLVSDGEQGLDEFLLTGALNSLQTRANPQLSIDIIDVRFNGAHCHEQPLGDFLIGAAGGD